MSTVAIIAGYGPGISHAAAEKFGAKGYKIALVSRTQGKLDKAAEELTSKFGYSAKGFAADLSDIKEVTSTVEKIKTDFGSIGIILWNPYGSAKPLDSATPEDIDFAIRLHVTSLQAALLAALDDLKANKGAVLVTGGALSFDVDALHDLAHAWKVGSMAVAKSAQRKWVAVAHRDLKDHGVFVGENTVTGAVKGTPFDSDGTATLTAEKVAEYFVTLLETRKDAFIVTAP